MTRVKICGLRRLDDIRAVNRAKPDFAGFVFAVGRRQVSLHDAAGLKQQLDPAIKVVGVFQNQDPDFVLLVTREVQLDLVQLHGAEDDCFVRQIRRAAGRPVIKAVAVRQVADIRAHQESSADFLLLDQGSGGTGKCFDWQLAQACGRPFFLAGGLDAENIVQAIRQLCPYAVDLSSGVETGGVKDPGKIETVVSRVRGLAADP